MWIDIHSHCYDFTDSELVLQLNKAASRQVHVIVNSATSLSTIRRVCEQARLNNMLYATVGVSPFEADGASDDILFRIQNAARKEKVVGVGEIGIDASNPGYPPMERQKPLFEQQLDCARRFNMPAVIHSRGCEMQAIEICKSIGVVKALFHCFTGSKQALRMLLDAGYYVSFSGIITFSKNNCNNLVQYTPLDRLFAETDTPYLAPEPHRGKPNCPAWVVEVGNKIARIKGIDSVDIAGQIVKNAEFLFGIPNTTQKGS